MAARGERALTLWQSLRQTWSTDAVLALVGLIEESSDASQREADAELEQFHSALIAFSQHPHPPGTGHLMRLEVLAEAAFQALDWGYNSLTPEQVAVASNVVALDANNVTSRNARVSPNTVFILAPMDGSIADLANALGERDFEVKEFRSTELLCRAMDTLIPGVLVIHARLLRGMTRIKGQFEKANVSGKVIAYTHERDVTHRLLAMRAGALAFFEPPLDSFKLIAKLEELLGRQQTPPWRVLVCDSEREHAVQCANWLMHQGMVARIVFDLKQTVAAANEFRPDLALVDFDAAEPRGFELVEMLNQLPELQSMTIVAYSQQSEEVHRLDAITAGADDFLLKPLKARHVVGLIKSRMQRVQRLLGQAAQHSRDARLALHPRERLLEQLAMHELSAGSGLLMVLVDRAETLRESLGLSGLLGFESDLARVLRAAVGAQDIVVQLRDFTYAVFAQREQREQLNELGEQLRRSVHELSGAHPSLTISLSVGAAVLHEAGLGADQRIAIAEGAAVAAQRIGGNRVLWFEPKDFSVARADQSLAIRAVLQKPLTEQNLRIRFRPLVPLCGKLPEQFDLQYNLASATDERAQADYLQYFPVAVDLGISRQLEMERIEIALKARQNGLSRGRQLRLFLPLSAQTACDTEYLVWLVDRLHQTGQSGTGLVFELSSDEMLDHRQALELPLKVLHKCGIRVGCRDFGANFAAVHVLNAFPLDFVRLHADLVQTATSANVLSGSLNALVKKAHQLGTAVIAPNVEALERAHVMMRLGIDYGVGDGLGGALIEPVYDFNRSLW